MIVIIPGKEEEEKKWNNFFFIYFLAFFNNNNNINISNFLRNKKWRRSFSVKDFFFAVAWNK